MEVKEHIAKQEQSIMSRSLFYFASFGAASFASLVVVLLVALVFETSTSSSLWIFLFLFPGALATSRFYVAKATDSEKGIEITHGIIAGYGTYSVISLIIVSLPNIEPANWFVLVLGLSALAVFFSNQIMKRLGISSGESRGTEITRVDDTAQSRSDKEVDQEESIKVPPVLLIRAPETKGSQDHKKEK